VFSAESDRVRGFNGAGGVAVGGEFERGAK
jgi:hypothetical protein